MSKRKLDEFFELAKDLSASDIAESLKALGPQKCRRIVSDPKVNTFTALWDTVINPNLAASARYERPASANNLSDVHSLQLSSHPTKMGRQHPGRSARILVHDNGDPRPAKPKSSQVPGSCSFSEGLRARNAHQSSISGSSKGGRNK